MIKYPRIGETRKLHLPKNKHPQCKLCKGLDADTEIHIQYNWFRGDDEVYKVHRECMKAAPEGELVKRLSGSK